MMIRVWMHGDEQNITWWLLIRQHAVFILEDHCSSSVGTGFSSSSTRRSRTKQMGLLLCSFVAASWEWTALVSYTALCKCQCQVEWNAVGSERRGDWKSIHFSTFLSLFRIFHIPITYIFSSSLVIAHPLFAYSLSDLILCSLVLVCSITSCYCTAVPTSRHHPYLFLFLVLVLLESTKHVDSHMVWIKRALESVSKETIQNCWRVTGLLGNTDCDKESDQIGKELQQLQA